jgi:cytochrome c biogenesis protein CcdA/thiol-disulfide isomerase/thioredoxin
MNLADFGGPFLEGLALILSPCILPVLPLILATSIDGGRTRPFGVITGFIISFAAFTLLSRKLVNAFNIDLDIIKYASLTLLAAFGFVLLSSKLSEKFAALTQPLANLGGSLSASAKGGFFSGILIGALIGLVWTPCAGPILAIVLVQVIRQQTDTQGLFVILSFAIGAGVPMLIIALTGRQIMGKLGFFTRYADTVRKGFGVLILIAVAFIYSGIDPQSLFTRNETSSNETSAPILQMASNEAVAGTLQHALAKPYEAPEFKGIETWLNSKPLTMKGLRGKVVLVDFWTYSCINCVRTLPYITSWDKKYRDKGLVIVGVHSPEFEFEKKRENVEAAIAKDGIQYPVAQDNHLDTFTAFNNQFWPAHYLINREGQVVYTHFGEGEYAQTENNIRVLLGLTRTTDTMPEHAELNVEETPETYLGSARAERFKSSERLLTGKVSTYTLPQRLPKDGWGYSGSWKVEDERAIAQSADSSLRISFTAQKVFLVLANSTGKPLSASVTLNGASIGDSAGKDAQGGTVNVKENTLYELVDQKQPKNGVLDIKANAPGLEVYAFTFG